MKKSIFNLGIALLAFTNVALAEKIDQSNEKGTFSVAFHAPVGDVVLQPESLANAERPIEEIIDEDNKITESAIPAAAPIYTRLTIEETIAEDNKIIESQITNDVYPLDFTRINRNPDFTKIRNNSQAGLFDNN
jgi:hypothetical protein